MSPVLTCHRPLLWLENCAASQVRAQDSSTQVRLATNRISRRIILASSGGKSIDETASTSGVAFGYFGGHHPFHPWVAQLMKRVPISLFILLTVRAAHGTTFTVVNTNDSRHGSLRHASTGANASAGTGDEDFLYRAHVNHPTLDDNADTHPADDDCPRALAGRRRSEPGRQSERQRLRQQGQGTGQSGADVLTDVIQK